MQPITIDLPETQQSCHLNTSYHASNIAKLINTCRLKNLSDHIFRRKQTNKKIY